jgi:hypothetical protein
MPAPEAPVCWTTSAAAPILDAICDRPTGGSSADLSVATHRSARNLIVGPGGEENFILRDSGNAATLRLHGSRASLAPVSANFLVCGIPQPQRLAANFSILYGLVHCPERTVHVSRDRLLLRDALVALDGRCVGASYREMAAVLYGAERARAEWSGVSRAMKDHMRRALAKGEGLRDGGHRELLE